MSDKGTELSESKIDLIPHEKKSLSSRTKASLKANFLAGVLFLTPVVVTFYSLWLLAGWIDGVLSLLPRALHPETYLPFRIPGLGIILVGATILLTGMVVRNYLGKHLVGFSERVIARIPLVNKFYWGTKQLMETIVSGAGKDLNRVVLVEFPKNGMYSLGYVTGVAVGEIQEKTKKRVLNIYVPTTPNPTSGFYLIVPEDEVIALDMSVEDSFKLLISGGIINPEDPKYNGVKLKGIKEASS